MKYTQIHGRRAPSWAIGLLLSLLLILPGRATFAAIINASSVSFAAVSAAVGSASPGDTVIIPAGTASWQSTLTIPSGITLQGATTVSGDHTTGSWTANDLTVIRDSVPISGAAGNAVLITFNCPAGQSGRITGITFNAGSRTTRPNTGGIVLNGWSTSMRIDHCNFSGLTATNLNVEGGTRGVIDHCIFNQTDFVAAIFFENGGDQYGDLSWTQPTGFGTSDFMFVEDCYFAANNPSVQNAGGLDCYKGGKYVVRYSTFSNAKPNTHGTDSPGRLRSSRAIEIYNNVLNWAPGNAPTGGQLRGGCALIHDNAYTNYQSGMGLRVYREFGTFAFPAADGTSGWDQNSDASGNAVAAGQPGYLFFTGTHNGASGAAVLSDSKANFPNLSGYVIRNMGDNHKFKWNSYVASNTATTVTLNPTSNGNPINNAAYTWNSGDVYEIRKVLIALDQPGRGVGDLIAGDAPNMKISGGPNSGRVAWPRQALEPVYGWNNTNNGSGNMHIGIGSYGEPTLTAGVDFYDGTAMPGYTPYQYPHPLVSGPAAAPQAPKNLHVVP
jgi:hypothetical protein